MRMPASGNGPHWWTSGSGTAYLAILVALVLAIPATQWAKERAERRLERDIDTLQDELLGQAGLTLQGRFFHMQADMRSLAEFVAGEKAVRSALDTYTAQTGRSLVARDQIAVIRWFDRLEVPPNTAVELYAQDGELIAWSGFSFERGGLISWAPVTGTSVRLISGGLNREAIELAFPVLGAGGYVRVVRLIGAPQRVSDRITGMSGLADELTAGLPVVTTLTSSEAPIPDSEPGSRRNRAFSLVGLDGDTLGVARVTAPSASVLSSRIAARYANVEAFWTALLLAWIAAGIVLLNRAWRRVRQSSVGRIRPGESIILVGIVIGALVGLRYGLLSIDVPARWFPDAAVFDPRFLASTLWGGVARSVGDLLLSVGLLLAGSLFILEFSVGATFTEVEGRNADSIELRRNLTGRGRRPSWTIFIVGSMTWLVCMGAASMGLAILVRRAILDSTLDYFAWTGLAPEPLVLLVLVALVTAALATILIIGALTRLGAWWLSSYRPQAMGTPLSWMIYAALLTTAACAAHFASGAEFLLPWWVGLLLFAVGVGLTGWDLLHAGERERLLYLGTVLAVLLLVMAVVYPLVYRGMMIQRDIRMEEVADDYVARKDDESRIVVETVLGRASRWRAEQEYTAWPPIREFVERPALPFQDEYGVSVFLVDESLELLAFARTNGAPLTDQTGSWKPVFDDLLSQPPNAPEEHHLVRRILPEQEGERTLECGLTALQVGSTTLRLLVVAAPRSLRFARQDPDDLSESLQGYPDWRRGLSIAEYEGERLVRTEGRDFGRTRLPAAVHQALQQAPEIWRVDDVYGQPYATYYRRQAEGEPGTTASIIAVRTRETVPYDHLYYLLRIAVGGLLVAALFYLGGILLRWRSGSIPSPEQRFGDKILSAFLGVGTVTVFLTGWFGQNVILRENQGAIQSRLERRLERVEHALYRLAKDGESPASVIARVSIDTLADELSLDLNVYRGAGLWRSSATDQQERLIEYSRLPIQAYEDLYVEGYRRSFVTLNEGGDAAFTIGYLALLGDDGKPEAAVSVLTIPEQERIREERARTSAYLFGSLLVLLLFILGTATFLANRLATPIRRLHSGLRTVAEGRFSRPIPVETRDELGALVGTFNTMQDQLAESRSKLAQQERELAWREMAKQVAHEIKNPLTPMKLSVQHLQRAFYQGEHTAESDAFVRLFGRITESLTEQIDALAHIANEFYTFARLPKRHLELLDLVGIVKDAAGLMSEETSVPIHIHVPDKEIRVEADRDELMRVFINLLKNAVQAIPNDGEGIVTVAAWFTESAGDGRMAMCSVTDTGSGIPPEIRDRIFQPNFSTKTSGMGLGLAIVKQSVEAMNGTISFETTDGAGTTFTVALPLARDTE